MCELSRDQRKAFVLARGSRAHAPPRRISPCCSLEGHGCVDPWRGAGIRRQRLRPQIDAPRLLQVAARELPVDEVVNDTSDIHGTALLVIEVVRMLPHV